MRQAHTDVDALLEDLAEFRGWLAGYEDLVRHTDQYEDSIEQARLDEIHTIIDEYDHRVARRHNLEDL